MTGCDGTCQGWASPGPCGACATPEDYAIRDEAVAGPRYIEAVEASRVIRRKALIAHCLRWGDRTRSLPHCQPVTPDERDYGIPASWIAR